MPNPRSFALLIVMACTLAACRTRRDTAADTTLGADLAAASATPGSGGTRGAGDYGPPGDVSTVRAAWLKESSGNDTIPQIVVVADYGVVEVRNGGPNSPFFVLFKRDQAGAWQDQGITIGAVGLCGLTSKMVPDRVAREIVAHDTRLATNQHNDPRAGCSGAI